MSLKIKFTEVTTEIHGLRGKTGTLQGQLNSLMSRIEFMEKTIITLTKERDDAVG